MKLKMNLKGFEKAKGDVVDWKDSRMKALEKTIKETGRAIRKDARRRAPKRTGRLRKGIKFIFRKSKKKGMIGYVRATAPYSHLIENGSAGRNIAPKPFMKPAFDAAQPAYVQKIEYIMGFF